MNRVNGASRSVNSVALGDRGASIIGLFDKDGANWVQWPSTKRPTIFGLWSCHQPVLRVRECQPIVALAVRAPGAGLVRVYQNQTNGCKQIGRDIVEGGASSPFGTLLLE